MADSPFTVGAKVRCTRTTGRHAGETGTVKQLDTDGTTLVTFPSDSDYWVANSDLEAVHEGHFPVGSRVEYIGTTMSPQLRGKFGKVTGSAGHNQDRIEWEDGTHTPTGILLANLRLAPAAASTGPQLRLPPTPTEVELAYLMHQVNDLTKASQDVTPLADLTAVREQLSQVQRRYLSFKDQVREVAIRVAGEQSWCDTGLNEVLEELGLDPKTSRWTVSFDVKVYVDVEDVSDAEEAEQEATGNLDISVSYGNASVTDWDLDSYSVNVEAAD